MNCVWYKIFNLWIGCWKWQNIYFLIQKCLWILYESWLSICWSLDPKTTKFIICPKSISQFCMIWHNQFADFGINELGAGNCKINIICPKNISEFSNNTKLANPSRNANYIISMAFILESSRSIRILEIISINLIWLLVVNYAFISVPSQFRPAQNKHTSQCLNPNKCKNLRWCFTLFLHSCTNMSVLYCWTCTLVFYYYHFQYVRLDEKERYRQLLKQFTDVPLPSSKEQTQQNREPSKLYTSTM